MAEVEKNATESTQDSVETGNITSERIDDSQLNNPTESENKLNNLERCDETEGDKWTPSYSVEEINTSETKAIGERMEDIPMADLVTSKKTENTSSDTKKYSSESRDDVTSEQDMEVSGDYNNDSSGRKPDSEYGGARPKTNRKNRFNFNCLNPCASDDEADEDIPQELIWKYRDDKRSDFEFFWQSYSIYSQWYRAGFIVDEVEYNCAEQYMMQQKAVLMGDLESAEIIMALDEPREQKAMGRSVKNWDQKLWEQHRWAVVKKGNMAKFTQNEELKGELISTYPKILVEASPLDTVWGIGLGAKDKRAHNRARWRGKNLLGYIITEVRDEIMRELGMMDDSAPAEGKNIDPEKTGAESFGPEKDMAENSEIEKVKSEDMNSSSQENEDQNMNNASDKSETDVASNSSKQQISEVTVPELKVSNNDNQTSLKSPDKVESIQNEKEDKDTIV